MWTVTIILAYTALKFRECEDPAFITLSNATYLPLFQPPYTQMKNTWIYSTK